MNKLSWKKFAVCQRSPFLSPKDMVQRASAISALFLLVHLAGFREYTGILNGTIGSLALGWDLSTLPMQNDETEQFEQRLKRQPLRQIPAEWRKEILSAAHKAQPARHSIAVTRVSFLSVLNRRIASLLWPHPVAWAGLAAVWIFILGVNVSLRDSAPVMAQKTPPPSPEMIAELRQQQRLLAELIGPGDVNIADRPKTFAPRPRSERVEILVV